MRRQSHGVRMAVGPMYNSQLPTPNFPRTCPLGRASPSMPRWISGERLPGWRSRRWRFSRAMSALRAHRRPHPPLEHPAPSADTSGVTWRSRPGPWWRSNIPCPATRTGRSGADRKRQDPLRNQLPGLPWRGSARRRHRRSEPAPLAAGSQRSARRIDPAGRQERANESRDAGDASAAAARARRESDRRVHPCRRGDDAAAGVAAAGCRTRAEYSGWRCQGRTGLLRVQVQFVPLAGGRPQRHRREGREPSSAAEPLDYRRGPRRAWERRIGSR